MQPSAARIRPQIHHTIVPSPREKRVTVRFSDAEYEALAAAARAVGTTVGDYLRRPVLAERGAVAPESLAALVAQMNRANGILRKIVDEDERPVAAAILHDMARLVTALNHRFVGP